MNTTFQSAQDVAETLSNLPAPDKDAIAAAASRQAMLTKPAGSLGRLEDMALWMAGWQRTPAPAMAHGRCLVFAGNHGVVAQGISAFPPEVTVQMVANFEAGGAAINQLCRQAGIELEVVPIEIERPTKDFTQEPAMTLQEVLDAMNIGAGAIGDECDYLCVGEMGIGNTTVAAALAMANFGGAATKWAGPGTGLDAKGVRHKADIVDKAVKRHRGDIKDAVDLLAALGGRELAAIAGAVLAARVRGIPVMLDGYISSTAAASLAFGGRDDALDHCLVSHMSAEPGHAELMKAIDARPVLDLGMRLGEASGAAVATLVVRAALATHNGMATFGDAGVSEAS